MTDLKAIEAAVDAACAEAWERGNKHNHGGFPDTARTALLTLVAGVCKDAERYKEALVEMERAVDSVMGVQLSDEDGDDNVAIALCTYLDDSTKRPLDDVEDGESWTPWVRSEYSRIERRIKTHLKAALAATDEVPHG
jgi:hypothetical protein